MTATAPAMTPFRAPSLRQTLVSSASSSSRARSGFSQRFACQRRWAQVHDVRFLATQQSDHRVLEKYREKLDRKAKEEGLQNISELKEAYKDKISTLRQQAAIPLSTGAPPQASQSSSSSSSPFPPPPPAPQEPPSPTLSSSPLTPTAAATQIPKTTPALKTLSSFLHLSKIATLPTKEIEALWRLRHINNPRSLCASIPVSTYRTIEATAKKHPYFILPLPKAPPAAENEAEPGSEGKEVGEAQEIHFLQWTFPAPDTVSVLFTHLAEYKLRGEFSQPHTTVTHHLELADTKGLVLLQGNVMEGRGVSVDEARWLVLCLQRFYGGVGGEGEEGRKRRRGLVEKFGRGDESFSWEELVEEAGKLA